MDSLEALMWCLGQNYHADKMNACIHCAPVRFSPLTFRIYETIMAQWPTDEDITAEMAELRHHHGMYEEDTGR